MDERDADPAPAGAVVSEVGRGEVEAEEEAAGGYEEGAGGYEEAEQLNSWRGPEQEAVAYEQEQEWQQERERQQRQQQEQQRWQKWQQEV